MNVNKHMEAIFLTTLAIVGAGSLVIDRLPDAHAAPAAAARPAVPVENAVGTPGHMAVVVVRGHLPARRA